MRGEGRITRRSELGGAFWARVDAADVVADDAEVGLIAQAPEQESSRGVWQQRILGIAVAAGVAAAVIIGLGGGDTAPGFDSAEPAIAEMQASQTMDARAAGFNEAPAMPGNYPSAEDLQRIQAYMLHHEQQVALSNQARAVPFVKVAAFESR
jgi:hypothetical protein